MTRRTLCAGLLVGLLTMGSAPSAEAGLFDWIGRQISRIFDGADAREQEGDYYPDGYYPDHGPDIDPDTGYPIACLDADDPDLCEAEFFGEWDEEAARQSGSSGGSTSKKSSKKTPKKKPRKAEGKKTAKKGGESYGFFDEDDGCYYACQDGDCWIDSCEAPPFEPEFPGYAPMPVEYDDLGLLGGDSAD